MLNHIDELLVERFSKDSCMALSTMDKNHMPWSRTIDAFYFDGSFYAITHAKSKKINHININPLVAMSGEWFSCHAMGINLGYIRLEENLQIAQRLKTAFASWYNNGHINENDVDTVILKLELIDGIIFSNGNKYEF